MALVFLAVAILGIIAIVLVPKFRGIGVGILVFSIVGLVVSVAGLVGAGFEKNAEGEEKTTETRIKATLLVLFFAIMCILHILFMIFGVALICIRTSVQMLVVTLTNAQWEKLFTSLPKSFRGNWSDAISKIQNFTIALGVVMIVISVIILITCIAAAIQMGPELLAQFYMGAFSIIEIIIGFSLAIFLLIMNASHNTIVFGIEIGKNNIIVPIVIFGFVLAAVGIIGFVAIFIGDKYKFISGIFIVGNIIVLIAFVVLFILCIVFHALILGWADDLCKEAGSCDETLAKANQNMCPDKEPETYCYTENKLKKDVGAMLRGFSTILLFVCLYLVLFLVCVVISTCANCLKKNDNPEYEENRPLKDSFY